MTVNETTTISFPKIRIPPCFLNEPAILSTWRYEHKRDAQAVLPYLYIGPLGVIRNESFLIDKNIRVLISLMRNSATVAIIKHKYMHLPEFKCMTVDPGDPITSPTKIVSQLPSIIEAIEFGRAHGCATLLFCETGNDSSALAAIAYMMEQYRMGLTTAVQYVQSKRFSIELDDQALYNLQTFESHIKACSNLANSCLVSSRQKNARERDDDDDDDNKRGKNDHYGSHNTNGYSDVAPPSAKR